METPVHCFLFTLRTLRAQDMVKCATRFLVLAIGAVCIGFPAWMIHHTTRTEADGIQNKKNVTEGLYKFRRKHWNETTARNTTRQTHPAPKVFIYTLPSKFNTDIIRNYFSPKKENYYSTDIQLNNHGFGDRLYEDGEMGVYNTHMFSLEVILHHQLINSRYRTLNPQEADLFYIPAYLGLTFYCRNLSSLTVSLQSELFQAIRTLPYFDQGRPHFSAIAKIEREQFYFLTNPQCRKVTYVVIEKESLPAWRKIPGNQNIVAPYPSYVHRDNLRTQSQAISSPGGEDRPVFVFLAAGKWVSTENYLRRNLIKQFTVRINGISYDNYLKYSNPTPIPKQLMLVTINGLNNHRNITVDWMQRSVFCLQPHGDSPTRKSFYDAIQSGCIPVIFKYSYEHVEYPFQNVLNYTEFVVSIDAKRIIDKQSIFDILMAIPRSDIQSFHSKVKQVARKLQYSVSNIGPKTSTFTDALDMIIQQVVQKYNITI